MFILLILSLALGDIVVPITHPKKSLRDLIVTKLKSPSNQLKDSKLFNHQELYYSANLQIGTKGQNFSLIIDTGSSVISNQYTWVEQKGCRNCTRFSHQFDVDKSTTYTNLSVPVELRYGDGSFVFGFVSQDFINIDDTNPISAECYFVLVNRDEMSVDTDGADGILGLGFKELSDDYNTIVDSLYLAGKIQKRLFSLYLNHLGDIGQQQGYGKLPSSLQIGGYDLKKYAPHGKSVTIDINEGSGFWYSIISSFEVGNYKLNKIPVIFDSGTTLILVDINSYNNLFNTITHKHFCIDYGLIICSCESKDVMPELKFDIGGVEFKLNQETAWYYEKGQCILLVQGAYIDFWILGAVFLQNFYTVFNMDTLQITLASVYEDFGLKGISLMWLVMVLSSY